MNFELTEEQIALREGIRRFVQQQYLSEEARKRASGAVRTDRARWQQFAELGWLGVLVPDSCGGLGLSLTDVSVVLEEFGRGLVTEPYLDCAVLAARLLGRVDSEITRDLLAKLVTGEALIATAMLEAGERYKLVPARTNLTRAAGDYRLNGRKILADAGDICDGFLTLAAYEGGSALIYVPANSAGVTRTGYRLLDGGFAADVTFSDVKVARQALLADGPTLDELLTVSIDEAAFGAAALAIGCMDRILELTVEYLGSRQQFGRTLSSFQVLQHRIVDLYVEIEMARSALFGALSAFDRSPAARGSAVSASCVRVGQAALRVGTQGIHLHGGIGMTMAYPVGHYYRRLQRLTRSYGDIEHHLERYERLAIKEG
jgi:alkylation response protein AidB-like acyl-CoA dehydrogenase